ncbi:MAG: PorT family protein [Bacteroidales bacterium]|nr:PorT family protein [Bacteroidales bacterium]
MPNKILIFLVLSLGYQTLTAQDLVDCTYLLEDAREAYDAGMVELVPELLLECIESEGLTGESRKEAYKLVINSYLFDYLPGEADSLMDGFVGEFPEYRAENSDPQEFVFLLDAHLRALGINPDQLPGDTVVVAAGDTTSGLLNRRRITKGAGEFGNSLGIMVGSALSLPQTVERYSVGNPATDESHFGLLPGVMVGADANLILNRRLEASFGLLYSLTRFSYSATPLTFTTYRYVEAQHQLLLPLSMVYKFNPDDRRMCYYLRGGVVPGYLFHASGRGTRSYEASLDDLVVEKTDITESRRPFNLNILVGAGFRIPLNNAFFYLETRVTSGILLANREENRYPNNDLSWLLYHVDSDFRVHQLSICAGICWDLTKQ